MIWSFLSPRIIIIWLKLYASKRFIHFSSFGFKIQTQKRQKSGHTTTKSKKQI